LVIGTYRHILKLLYGGGSVAKKAYSPRTPLSVLHFKTTKTIWCSILPYLSPWYNVFYQCRYIYFCILFTVICVFCRWLLARFIIIPFLWPTIPPNTISCFLDASSLLLLLPYSALVNRATLHFHKIFNYQFRYSKLQFKINFFLKMV